MNLPLAAAAIIFALPGGALIAKPLDAPEVSRAVNEVRIASSQGEPAGIHAELLRVGPQSRAEIVFPDRTLGRLGAETVLGCRRGTRELSLGRGTLLLEVPGFRGGARVRTGSLTAVCGAATILVEHLPLQSVKIVVLTGDLRVSTGGFFGDHLVIPAGKMLIAAPDATALPAPVDVDLSVLLKTSALIDAAAFFPGSAPLASLPRIERELARQAAAVRARRLIPTNLAILGSGTNVVIPGPASARAERPGTASAPAVGKERIAMRIPNSAEIVASQRPAGPSLIGKAPAAP